MSQTVCSIDIRALTWYYHLGDRVNNLYESLGLKIRETRKKRGLTQASLARAASLTRTSITNIEAGRQRLPLDTLYEIASALRVTPPELLPDTPNRFAPAGIVTENASEKEVEWIQRVVESVPLGDSSRGTQENRRRG